MTAFLYVFLLWLHPVHISVTEIDYSEKDKALQIMSRIFIDDLELAIGKERNLPELDVMMPANGLTTDKLVAEYLNKHLRIKVDGKLQKLNYLGHEVEDAALICYIEIQGVKNVKSLEAFDDVIMAIHRDQSNLVHVTYKSPVKSARLTGEKPSEVFMFEH
jgi:hypothetical protein